MSKIKPNSKIKNDTLDLVSTSNICKYYQILKAFDRKYSARTALTFLDFCQSVGIDKVDELLSDIVYTSTCEKVGAELTCLTKCSL